MNIHIVDSVKGGSGKSTFSLKLCCALNDQDNIKPCVIDLDLLGTSWFHLFSNCDGIKERILKHRIIYLNELVHDFRYYKNMLFIQKVNLKVALVNSSSKSDKIIDVIICNPDPKAKEDYVIVDNLSATDITYDIFCDEIMELINYLDEEGYTDIILDMPPNTEPYSNKVLNACLCVKPKISCIKNVSLYMVSSINPAHINSTFEWYRNFIDNSKSQHIATKNNFSKIKENEKDNWFKDEQFKFFFVFNEIAPIFLRYVLKNLINPAYLNTAEQLAFYKVVFDDLYADSICGLLGFPVNSVILGTITINPLKIDGYEFYQEL